MQAYGDNFTRQLVIYTFLFFLLKNESLKIMKKLLMVLFSISLVTYSQKTICQNDAVPLEASRSYLDSFITENMKESGIVGLGAAIIVDKEIVWMKGYGYADRKNKIPFTPNTIMNIGSISKTVTGASLMHAVEEGLVSLDEDINSYLPFKVINPFFPAEKMTLRNLATHTSGITDRYEIYDSTYCFGGVTPEPLGDFLRNYFVPGGKYYSKDNFLNHKPGTYRDYSNIAAGLAGYIIETATGEPLSKYSKRHIFTPLKMNDTGWFLSEIELEKHSKLYRKQNDVIESISLYELTTYPDGGVRTSVSSLSKFFISLINGGNFQGESILTKESVEEMLTFQYTRSNKPENINLEEPNKNAGIFWSTKRNVTRIGHGGSDFGLKTEMFCDLKKEVGVILFINTESSTKLIYDELWKYGQALRDAKR